MPGKVNPVLPEAVTQVAAQVIGNDAAVAWGGANGAFELNVYIPMMARNILESFKLLTNVSKLLAERCITGLAAHVERLRELAESSPSIVTPLNSAIGYEEAAAVAKQALKERKTIRQTVIDRGLIGDKLSIEELDRRLTCWRWPRSSRSIRHTGCGNAVVRPPEHGWPVRVRLVRR